VIMMSISPEIKRYQRQKLLAIVLNTMLSIAALAVLGLVVGPRLGALYTEWLGPHDALRLFASAAVVGVVIELLTLPASFWSGYILEHRYHLSTQTRGGWISKRIKVYLLGIVFGAIFVYGLYIVLWFTGPWWWLCATAGWLFLTIVLGRIMPVLILPIFYKVTPLANPELAGRLRHLAEGTGLSIEGVYQLHLSEETRKANAALAGLGRSRRVLLGDTLLQDFSPEEIEVVFAHEVGHHVYRHLPKMIVLGVVLSLIGFKLVDIVLTHLAPTLGYSGLADPAALPLLMLVLALFGLVLTPLENALSRFFETQCDRYALDRTGNALAYRSAFAKLAELNKSDPDPHPLVTMLFYDHPPIRARLALAETGQRP
jgi:STE24 endopeptidase